MKSPVTVESLHKALGKMIEKGHENSEIIVHERNSPYNNRVLGVNIDEYEKKHNDKDAIKITVG